MQEVQKRVAGLVTLRHSVIITDTAGVVTFWNAAAGDLLGWTPEESLGQPLSELVTLEPTAEELVQRLDSDPEWSGEMALRKRSGTAFLARVHQTGLVDELGQLTGILRLVSDITDTTWAKRRQQEEGDRARRALGAATVGSWHLDTTTGLAMWDETMELLFGLEPGTFAGSRQAWKQLIHDQDRDWVVGHVQQVMDAGEAPIDVEFRVSRPGAGVAWLRLLGRTFTTAGTVTAASGVAFDITEQRRVAEERASFLAAERARRDRFTLLAEASAAFAESLDDEDVIAAVGKLVVPRLGDWFAIDLVEPTGIRTVATVHSDPSKRELVAHLGRRFGSGSGVVPEVPGVVQDGKARLLGTVDIAQWPEVVADAEHRAVLAGVGLRSLMIVPLTARGRTFGAMTFVIGDSDLSYSSEDVDLAEDLARRAALSIDNARLFADRTHVAKVLQRSLLPPELPDVPGARVAARYRAAVAGSDIGGDFYDVFQTLDDRWTLVLGDVSGKGTDAAVLTGLARHTIRAVAMRAQGPEEVLVALNHAVLAPEYGERFLTLALVQMDIRNGQADAIVSSAGHPSPIVVRNDGTVEVLNEVGAIVGLFEDVHIAQETVVMRAGDLLVLYTDGVLEARNRAGEFYGEDRLLGLLASFPGRSPAEVAERIESDVMAFQEDTPRDDVAILVVGIDDPAAAPVQEPTQ